MKIEEYEELLQRCKLLSSRVGCIGNSKLLLFVHQSEQVKRRVYAFGFV